MPSSTAAYLAMHKFPYAPELYSEETIFSFGCRFARTMGLSNGQIANKELFNRSFNSRVTIAPRGLAYLASRLPGLKAEDGKYLLYNHTQFNYDCAFIGDNRRSLIEDYSMGNDSLNSKFDFKPRALQSIKNTLSFCPSCNVEMLDRTGEVYWLREHQLPLSFICRRHGEVLLHTEIALYADISLENAACVDSCGPNCQPVVQNVSAKLRDRLIALSYLSLDFLHRTNYKDSSNIAAYYMDTLWRKGFFKSPKRLDRQLVADRMMEYLSENEIDKKLLVMDELHPYWFVGLTKGGKDAVDTNKHLVFIDFINNQPDINYYSARSKRTNVKAIDVARSLKIICRNNMCDAPENAHPDVVNAKHEIGKVTIRVRCGCGYIYSFSKYENGSIGRYKLQSFGPSLGVALDNAIRDGISPNRLACTLDLQWKTLEKQSYDNGFHDKFMDLVVKCRKISSK